MPAECRNTIFLQNEHLTKMRSLVVMNSLNITKVKMGGDEDLKMEIDYEKSIDGVPCINLVPKKKTAVKK
jgi:hypothetical protein